MRKIIIGDVHGCREEFAELLQKVDYVQGQDDLISVGDLVDRGPDPVGTVALAMEMKARLVMGNHEEKALRWLRHEAKVKADPKYKNPMKAIPSERMAEWRALTEAQVDYLKGAPHMLDLGNWLAVHAGFEPAYPIEKQNADRVTRVRYVNDKGVMVGYAEGSLEQPKNTVYWTMMWEGPKNVVYGHAVRSTTDPCIERFTDSHRTVKTIGIDTGCCFGGRLTAMILNDDESFQFAQVKAKKQYYPWPTGHAPS